MECLEFFCLFLTKESKILPFFKHTLISGDRELNALLEKGHYYAAISILEGYTN